MATFLASCRSSRTEYSCARFCFSPGLSAWASAPVEEIGVRFGIEARNVSVTSQLYCTGASGSTALHGPLQLKVLDWAAFGLKVAAKSSPMVSPNKPYEALTTVLPLPRMSQAIPARGTTSFHTRMSWRL